MADRLDQTGVAYPVHCCCCIVEGKQVAATWRRDGYLFCDDCKDVPASDVVQRVWKQGSAV